MDGRKEYHTMKAVIKPRIDLEHRTRLETVIPLRTPFIINIDPCDTCNFQCKFCPTGDRELVRRTKGRGHGSMELGLYKKLIDDICTFEDKVKVIRLYKDGEPLLNPNFAEMVRYAKDSGCCDRVDTTASTSPLKGSMPNSTPSSQAAGWIFSVWWMRYDIFTRTKPTQK